MGHYDDCFDAEYILQQKQLKKLRKKDPIYCITDYFNSEFGLILSEEDCDEKAEDIINILNNYGFEIKRKKK